MFLSTNICGIFLQFSFNSCPFKHFSSKIVDCKASVDIFVADVDSIIVGGDVGLEVWVIDVVGEEEFLSITFRGTGFMRYMIRFIIGYAMDVAYGKYDIESIDELLDDSSERHIIASKAPSRGSLLVAVEY